MIARTDIKRLLVMVHRPGWQDVRDFEEIASLIAELAPDISVLIVRYGIPVPDVERLVQSVPTLVFSPCAIRNQQFGRARIFCGRAIDKLTQLRRLKQLGVSVPLTCELSQADSIVSTEWGTHVLIKPSGPRSAKGLGFVLVPLSKLPEFQRANRGKLIDGYPLMVQQYIPTGVRARHYRVNTLFGVPLYCMLNERLVFLPSLSGIIAATVSDEIATNVHDPAARRLEIVNDSDVINIARSCHAAFPDIPLKGVDVVRHNETGVCFALELNCTSNTWAVSSNYFAEFRNGDVAKYKIVEQFGLFQRAAHELVKATRLYAAN